MASNCHRIDDSDPETTDSEPDCDDPDSADPTTSSEKPHRTADEIFSDPINIWDYNPPEDSEPPPALQDACAKLGISDDTFLKMLDDTERVLLGRRKRPALALWDAEIAPHRGHKSVFDDLTTLEQTAIADLLDRYTYKKVIRTLAQPRPVGLDLLVSHGSLKRFHIRWKKKQLKAQITEALKFAGELRSDPGASLDAANAQILKVRLLDENTAPTFNAANARRIAQSLRDLNHIEITKARLALAEKLAAHKLSQ